MSDALPEPLELSVRVRYCECDPMGVAHHSVYAVWFEMARTEMLRRDAVSYAECEARGVFFVVAKLTTRFRRPVRYDDVLRVRVALEPSGRIKLDHTYEVFRDDELVATGESTLVCVNRDGRPTPIPADILPE